MVAGLKDFGRDLPLDTRIVREIQRSPSMSAEQGSGWLSKWNGPQGYTMQARMTLPERVTYNAVEQGYGTEADISDATGLLRGEVSVALTKLQAMGLVEVGQVTK